MVRTALLQLSASDDPAANLAVTVEMVRQAASQGAGFIVTPEVTNCVSQSRAHQIEVLQTEADDPTLAALRDEAGGFGVWILIGSLALKSGDPDGRFANRSFMISPAGKIVARYDKIHMFDVTVSETETFRESAGYRQGEQAVIADTDFAKVGMTVCYDVRFPHLYRTLAKAAAQIITVPSAFSPVTGRAHWHILLRARAIETGAFILAPAQTGDHLISVGKPRRTFGHSLVISPWGAVLADAGTEPGITYADLDLSQVTDARKRLPTLTQEREFAGP